MFEDILGRPVTLKQKLKDFNESRKKYGFWDAYNFHVWGGLNGSSARILGVKIYGKHSEKQWFKYTIRPLYKFSKALSDANYWYKYRFVKKHKYNTVFTDLKPGYYDADRVMLHACFSLLVDYVEREQGGKEKLQKRIDELSDQTTWGQQDGYYNPPEMMQQSVNSETEVLALYVWWTQTRGEQEAKCDQLIKIGYSDRVFEFKPTDSGFSKMVRLKLSSEREKAIEDLRKLQDQMDADEQTMLHRLIDVRRSLWT